MMIIGIDPGISGSICFFQEGIIKDVIEMPTMTDGKKNNEYKLKDKIMTHLRVMSKYGSRYSGKSS